MEIEVKDNIAAVEDAEEHTLLPDGYAGGDLFPENEEKAAGETVEKKESPVNLPDNTQQNTEAALQRRDFRGEIRALLLSQPQLREKLAAGESLPREVISECVKNGAPLRTAYAEYAAKQARVEVEQMRRENEILKQNSAAAAKAPVRGTSAGGGTNNKGKDPFLEGLLSDE